ncbi:diaminopimelate epimerase [Megalodesulfovibrio gigas]|uniref:Diaminopimelate epimerase n=1 Tax=Megalodesulfovibrio gigas (strain ATCC 19364 / DSM 1382 / NCIMB 9332 / VKM B-1759) TaxID=1121448 RepID=T2GEY8_MEGG1|nr:diaminopimelate epimerase [Megalodesulfovibrio gigas]AGW14492.1 putative diaminopimelate epimerase [Megalodesulfovibrio gigas DSM 1382 = ATCC 19364]
MPGATRLLEFHKLHGCGNDFIFIDNRTLQLPQEHMARWATILCQRAFSIGADGLIFLESPAPDPGCDYRWHFFNADGSRAEMCGNASRCAATLAVRLDLAGPAHRFLTDAGPILAQVLEETPAGARVKVQLTPPHDLWLGESLALNGVPHTVNHVNTGVPHAVVIVDDVWSVDVRTLGRALRQHERFAPKGTNANFIQIVDNKSILLRTYERGVEDETYACGTGAAASALVAQQLGFADAEVHVTTTGKEVLTITSDGGQVFLTGAAAYVFAGTLDAAALGLPR